VTSRTMPRVFARVIATRGFCEQYDSTKPKQCTAHLPPLTVSALPERCPDRVFKASRCREHYMDWRNEKETRRGTEAVNPLRREIRALGLSGRQKRKLRKKNRRAAA
jgi:hypothetical protein